jgi:hypothetical protein
VGFPSDDVQEIHHATMDVAGFCSPGNCARYTGWMIANLGTGLSKPLKLPTFVPILQQAPHHVMIRPGDQCVNPKFFCLKKELLDPGSGKVPPHNLIHFWALVGKTAEWVASQYETADVQVS